MRRLIIIGVILIGTACTVPTMPLRVAGKMQTVDGMCAVYIEDGRRIAAYDNWSNYSQDNCKYEVGQELK